jgi:hypothetical protein
MNRKSRKRTARQIGLIFFAIGLALAYWVWPTGITSLPLGALLRAVAAVGIAIAAAVMAAMIAA